MERVFARLRIRRKPRPGLPQEVHSARAFAIRLAKERARTYRTGATFAVLAMTPPPDDNPPAALALLAVRAIERMSFTDEIGLLGPERLGIFLPDSDAVEGWKLVDDVRAMYAREEGVPSCRVYVYPSDDGIPLEALSQQEHTSDGARLREHQPPDDLPERNSNGQPSGLHLDHSKNGNGAPPSDSETQSTKRPPTNVQALTEAAAGEELFVRPMPAWKRTIDLLGGSLILLAATPLMLLTALAIKLTSRGPVFFVQDRAGQGGRPFRMYKFRSMRDGADAEKAALSAHSEQDGAAFKLKDDPRVTPIGRLLRQTSMDELPQLLNVLRGEMSLVGPRPLPCDETAACQPWQRERLDVTPGITCIWQVRGRSRVSFNDWMLMDLAYVRSRTIWSDLKLLFLTIPAVLLRRGAH